MQIAASVTSSGTNPAAEIQRLVTLSKFLPGELAQVAANTGAAEILAAARSIRGSLTMSNNKKLRGRKLDAKPIIRVRGTSSEAEIQAVPLGPWKLANDGAVSHRIGPKKGPGGRVRRTRTSKGKKRGNRPPALYVDYLGIFAAVDHPGTGGDRSWDHAMVIAEPKIDQAIQATLDKAWGV